MKQLISFPRVGIYTDLFKETFEELGGEVILPPPITQKTISLGVKHSSDMMCFPFKTCLGSLLEVLEMAEKENAKLTYMGMGVSNVSKSSCRFPHYFEIQRRIIKDLGYNNVDMILVEKMLGFGNIFKAFKKINRKNTYLKVLKVFVKNYKKAKELEKNFYIFDWDNKKKVRIGIIGEWYTAIENEINYDMYRRLKNLGVNVHQSDSLKLTSFLKHTIGFEDMPKKYIRQGKKFYDGFLPAHAKYSLWNMFFYKDHDFDGVVHLMPLTCMPESTVEMLMDLLSRKLDLPVYHFPIDEEVFETGFDMRIKSIIRILERKKCGLD